MCGHPVDRARPSEGGTTIRGSLRLLCAFIEAECVSATKYQVKVYAATTPRRVPKVVSEELKGGASPKMISKMKKESVDCPIVKKEIAFLVCFACPSFLRRVSGVVDCAGEKGPPQEWLMG